MTVWVTREEAEDGPLTTALRARGLNVLLEPVLERRLVADPAGLIAGLGRDDWLVLTSPYAIEAVGHLPAAKVPQVAVVGEPSRRLAEKYGLRVVMVGEDGHGRTLFDEMRRTIRQSVVCYPRSARADVPEEWPDVQLRAPVLYDTVPRTYDRTVAQRAVIAAVASPSAVDALGDIAIPLASIGRTTSAAIRRHGLEPVVEAASPGFEPLAEAIANYLSDSRHQRA